MFSAFDSQTRKKLLAAISCISIVGVSLSLVIPLLALRMEAAGFPASANGVHIAVSGLATLIGAPLTPFFARALGVRGAMFLAIALGVASLLAFAFVGDYGWWLAIRAVYGLALTVIFVVSEFWISSAAPAGQRGMVLGLYSTVLAVGFATGPALLSLVGWQGLPPFMVATAMLALAALPVALVGEGGAEAMEGEGFPAIGAIFVAAPAALGAALLYGALETGLEGLLPVFGLRSGFPPFWSTFQLTLYSLGNVVFPVPMGLIADRMNKMKLLGFFAIVGVIGALFLPGLAYDLFTYGLVLFLWGGVVSAAYPVGLSVLAEKFQGERLGAANAAYIMMYALGMMVGPPALGLGLDIASPHGLWDAVALFFVAYLVLLIAFTRPRPPRTRA